MALPNREVSVLLNDFPQIKLPYENLIHNKVFNSDIIFAIPEGKKYFLWFTEHYDKNCCFLLELNDKHNVVRVEKKSVCFNSILCYNTILYGTIFTYEQNLFFTIEDMFYYKGTNTSYMTWESKLIQMNDLLANQTKQLAYNSNFLVIGMPLITDNINNLINKSIKVPYKIKTIQYRHFNKKGCYFYQDYTNFLQKTETINKYNRSHQCKSQNIKHKNTNYSYIFLVKPDITNDIYHLYCEHDNKNVFYDVACIPNYVCSVMMNKLFRDIKENNNLDRLEESDDEEEFQNTNDDKFVDLNKSINMICTYHTKFKKWFPVSPSNNNEKIVQFQLINSKFK